MTTIDFGWGTIVGRRSVHDRRSRTSIMHVVQPCAVRTVRAAVSPFRRQTRRSTSVIAESGERMIRWTIIDPTWKRPSDFVLGAKWFRSKQAIFSRDPIGYEAKPSKSVPILLTVRSRFSTRLVALEKPCDERHRVMSGCSKARPSIVALLLVSRLI